MPLSWNEIRDRALAFSREWNNECSEDAEAKSFWDAAQAVLYVRAQFPTSTLADLYDPLTMPPELIKAHQDLDRAVDTAYGKTGFKTEAERVAFLSERYRQLTAPLATTENKGKKKMAKVSRKVSA